MVDPNNKFLLISNKLNRPDIGTRSIVRPRLISRLNKGLDKRITLISAPAGFGKTTLAAQWLNESPLRSAWLSLESDDGAPERFLRYVIAAIRPAVPEFCVKIWGLLSAVQLPPPEYLADVMISEVGALDGAAESCSACSLFPHGWKKYGLSHYDGHFGLEGEKNTRSRKYQGTRSYDIAL